MTDFRRSRLTLATGSALAAAAWLGGCAGILVRTSNECVSPPLGETKLYLRGAMNGWGVAEDYAMAWDCDAYAVTSELAGVQDFKISDAAWSDAYTFASPKGLEPTGHGPLVPVGRASEGATDNLRVRFDGWSTLRLSVSDDQPSLTVTRGAPRLEPLSDPRARGLRHDSRDVRHRSPFGAVPEGTEIAFALDAPPAVDRAVLVVERRRLEGNQEVLAYEEPERIPLTKNADSRWTGRRTFDAPAIYGYWFEVEIEGRRFVYQNNSAPIYWTTERGANGEGVATDAPDDPGQIRRFRLTVHARDHAVPEWAQQAIWYYIFPERFRNGDPTNDRRPGEGVFPHVPVEVRANWTDRPFRPGSGDGSDERGSNDFFGGDLAGITEKLDHIADLGATALYMTPIFTAASNHKYDTADYLNVDPSFGTTADFERLTEEAARRGIRVMVDASFNHTGRDSLYFDRYARHPTLGALEGGEFQPDSPYADWYRVDPDAADPEDRYVGWTGAKDLPELNEASPAFRDFVFGDPDAVTETWLDRGATGWRMDVAPWVPDDFWRAWRPAVKAHDPNALTIAEVWFDASKYLLGDAFDGTMNYIFRNAALDIAAGGNVATAYRNIELMRELYPPASLRASMNLLSTHDTARSLWLLGDHGTDPDRAAEARRRYRLAVLMQVAWPGAPTVFYGDEVGVTGGDDPDNRRTFPWADQGGRPDPAMLADIRRLIALRREHPVLAMGDLGPPLHADETTVVATRSQKDAVALIAINNAETERTLEVSVPPEFRGRVFVDAVTGQMVRADTAISLTLPPLFGAVLVSTDGAR